MRDLTTPEQRRIRDELVKARIQTEAQATAGVLACFRCEYCKLNFLDPERPDNFHQWVGWDHLIPRAKGGPDDVDNLVCSCWVCNMIKGQWDPSEGQWDPQFPDARPPRDEMIRATTEYIKGKKLEKDRQVQAWRDIVKPRL